MSFQAERQMTILDILRKEKTISVNKLSQKLKVSGNTIRRDLSSLEKQGVIKRTQGGAVLTEMNQFVQPFEIRKDTYHKEKAAIGRFAANLINDSDTIIMDAGTTTLEVVKNLINIKNLTILTNSVEILYQLINNPNIVVILSGGIIRRTSRSLIGMPAEQFFSQVHANKLFLAAGGVSFDAGLTNANMQEVPVKKKMIDSAAEVILLADHHKFGKISLSPFCPLSRVDKIITDTGTPLSTVKKLESMGIEVLIAEE